MDAVAKALARPIEPDQIRTDIAHMRERIFKEHGKGGVWNLKYARGGIVDIEFSAQALRLLFGTNIADLRQYRTEDVIRNAAENGLVPLDAAHQTINALRLYHALQAVLRLSDVETFDPANAPIGQREALVIAANKQLQLGLPPAHFDGLHALLVGKSEMTHANSSKRFAR